VKGKCDIEAGIDLLDAEKAMASRDNDPPVPTFTTNDHDQQEVARLQARLKSGATRHTGSVPTGSVGLPSVEICEGTHKYVQITASYDGREEQVFVVSRRNAAYHRNAAEPFIAKLEKHGYHDIEVAGGGRVSLDEARKKISIYGFSYGFGKANHALSVEVVQADPRYQDYDVTWSDDGY
jgi:phosphohistidine phosphatase